MDGGVAAVEMFSEIVLTMDPSTIIAAASLVEMSNMSAETSNLLSNIFGGSVFTESLTDPSGVESRGDVQEVDGGPPAEGAAERNDGGRVGIPGARETSRGGVEGNGGRAGEGGGVGGVEGNGGRAEEGGGVGAADIGGVEEPRRWARRCFHCHRTPCMFSAHQEAMVRYANHLDRRQTMLVPGGKVHDAFLRKYMYQHFVMRIPLWVGGTA